MLEMEKQDKYLKSLIQESSDFSLGDDFTDSLMQKIQLEEIVPAQKDKSYEMLWQGFAIAVSFVALVAYLLFYPKIIVHILQAGEFLISQISISPSVLSVFLGVLLIFGLDFLFRNRFTRSHYMF